MSSLLSVIDFAVLFFMIQKGTPFVMKFSKTYKNMNQGSRIQFNNRVVSTIHSVLAFVHSLTSIYTNKIQPYSKITDISDYAMYSMEFSTGYFLWDLFASLEEQDTSYLLHAIACLGVFSTGCIDPSITMFIIPFLMYECSTPFINIRWFLLKFKYLQRYIASLEKLIFILFFVSRIGIGLPIQYKILNIYYSHFEAFPTIKGLGIMFSNIALGGLNVYWCGKMVYKFLMK